MEHGTMARLSGALADRYRVERELGQGGMSTVHLAHDLRHDRKVALKVMRPELVAIIGADRFLAEIRTTASLQHPHILPLHDSGEIDGTAFYVMPFVQGESLRGRLDREKQLPVEDAVRIGREVADALAHAHARGVVHRDIKPENILLQDDHALVADFGIALAVHRSGDRRLTQTGMSLGTPSYMAPEQAMGAQNVDHRADIYALGAVIYEMLAGDPPFRGPTAQAIVAKVITERPGPLSSLRETVPAGLERALHKALAKLPADRYASASEFARALEHGESSTPVPAGRSFRGALPTGVTVALVGAALAAGWVGATVLRSPPSPEPPVKLSFLAGQLRSAGGGGRGRQLELTADGSAVVYQVYGTERTQIFLRSLDGADSTRLAASDGGVFGITRDSTAIVVSVGRLLRVPLNGAAAIRGAMINTTDLALHPDGSIWLTRAPYDVMERIPPGGDGASTDTVFSALPALRIKQVFPDGRTALLAHFEQAQNEGSWFTMDLRTGERKPLGGFAARDARYSAGYLVYATGTGTTSLHAVPFDLRRHRSSGASARIAEHVAVGEQGVAHFAVAENGTVAYMPPAPLSLVFVDRSGNARRAVPEDRLFHGPRFSPDGGRIAVDITGPDGRGIWLFDPTDTTLVKLNSHTNGHDPSWMPDGIHVTFTTQTDTTYAVHRVLAASGAMPDTLFKTHAGIAFTGLWTRNGTLFTTLGRASGDDVAQVKDFGKGAIEPVVATPESEAAGAVSLDGRWLAFIADYTGRRELYVKELGGSQQVQVSQEGADEPLWSRDGRELFYKRNTETGARLMVARVRTSPTLKVVERRPLFDVSQAQPSTAHANYDISPDGRTFVMVRQAPTSLITVLQNLRAYVQRTR